MKHLKTYSQREFHYNEEFNWNPFKKKVNIPVNLKQDIREICYDITDDGKFDIKFNTIKPSGGFNSAYYDNRSLKERNLIIISPTIHKKDEFNFTDVKEVVLRIIDYLGSKFSQLYIHDGLFGWDNTLYDIKDVENLENVNDVRQIYIRYNP